ncbi:MAG: tRNA epoxyqueuosine(34) reductase QueG [Proteobacteria bacterium]|nr:tRNA epoxyqueuosine(34) reductase QueG [Pseudomonadota bacterium]
MSTPTKERIKQLLLQAGFSLVGFLHFKDCELGDWISKWIKNGYHADMDWMEQYGNIRSNPSTIENYTKSIVSVAINYKTNPPISWETNNPISNYAWGEDYHVVLRKKLNHVLDSLKNDFPQFKGRVCIDTAPLPEKIIAQKSGVGWIGKNSMLINRRLGSYLFLAEVVSNLDIASDAPAKDYCGTCTKCIDSCPTNAIVEDGVIDSNRCISYLTIEKRGEFSKEEKSWLDYQLFGCDICQQVCPWNKKGPLSNSTEFQFDEKWLTVNPKEWSGLTQEMFDRLKIKSPVKRAKYRGFIRNLQAISNK